jgi:hypothetical protein
MLSENHDSDRSTERIVPVALVTVLSMLRKGRGLPGDGAPDQPEDFVLGDAGPSGLGTPIGGRSSWPAPNISEPWRALAQDASRVSTDGNRTMTVRFPSCKLSSHPRESPCVLLDISDTRRNLVSAFSSRINLVDAMSR